MGWSPLDAPGGAVDRGLTIIEHLFYRDVAKQHDIVRRLLAMHAPIHFDRPLRPVATTALRTALAVVAAMLLILVVLPAILEVQAATTI
jgi:hypothetical protein